MMLKAKMTCCRLLFWLTIAGALFATNVYADDPLLLSDADMQKLKAYFPATDTTNEDNTHFVWNGDPIAVTLPLNSEKRLIFPTHISVDVKGALTTDQLRIIDNDKSLYLTALKPFSTTRIYVTLQDSNEVVLIDLATGDKTNNATTYIDIKQNNESTNSVTTSTVSNVQDSNSPQIESDTYVTLMRFAWQQLYAPARLLTNPLNISRAPMHTQSMLATLVYGDKVYAHPAVSWQQNNTYITAIELRNKYAHPTTIHLSRDLCGDWLAAAIYPHQQLKPAGNKPGDSAVLFVISNQPFGDSMEVCDGHA